MLRLVGYVAALALLVTGAVWIADRPGEVMVQWIGWRLDTTVPVLLLLLVISGGVSLAAVMIAQRLGRLPATLLMFRSRRAQKKGMQILAEAVSAVQAESLPLALKKARQAEKALKDPAPARLLVAQLLLDQGDDEAARALLLALKEDKATALGALRGLVRLAEKERNASDLMTYAARALDFAPTLGWAVRALVDAQVRCDLLDAAQKTLEDGRKKKALDEADYSRLSAAIYCARSEQASTKGQIYEATRLARKAVLADDAYLPSVLHYVRSLVDEGHPEKAATVIEGAWKGAPHPLLAQAYLDLWPTASVIERAKYAEQLANYNQNHVESRIFAATHALEANLWGSVRSRLKPLADASAADPRVGMLMAQVEEADGNAAASVQWLRQAARSGLLVKKDSTGWFCRSCGHLAHRWGIRCTQCDAVGALDQLD